MNLADHKVATAVGALGVAIILGHVVLGRGVVPPAFAMIGAVIAAAAGLFIALAGRRSADRPDGSDDGQR